MSHVGIPLRMKSQTKYLLLNSRLELSTKQLPIIIFITGSM